MNSFKCMNFEKLEERDVERVDSTKALAADNESRSLDYLIVGTPHPKEPDHDNDR